MNKVSPNLLTTLIDIVSYISHQRYQYARPLYVLYAFIIAHIVDQSLAGSVRFAIRFCEISLEKLASEFSLVDHV